MKRLAICLVLLVMVPKFFLDPLGRPAFLGYYLGIVALWLTFACVGTWQQRSSNAARAQ